MLRILTGLFILVSCSMGTVKTGGDRPYVYDYRNSYTSQDLKELSDKVVLTLHRDPQSGKLSELFGPGQAPLKRVGIVVFESRIQQTLDGLAGKNLVYLSPAGKQIMTENFHQIWEKSINVLASDFDYFSSTKIKKSPAFHQYGSLEEDHVKTKRFTLAPDDIFFLESGKKTTTASILNPRGMRDVSFLLVPASELMGGPKWSEHNKHFLNDVAKNLKLDALIVVMSDVGWTAAHTDKHSGEFLPEEIKVKISASTLIPLSSYHERLQKIKKDDRPNVTLCYRTYETVIKVPVVLSVPEEEKTFETIQTNVVGPVFKTYKDLSQMMIMRLTEDLKKTW